MHLEPSFFPDGVSIIYYCPHFLHRKNLLARLCVVSSLTFCTPRDSRLRVPEHPSQHCHHQPKNHRMFLCGSFKVLSTWCVVSKQFGVWLLSYQINCLWKRMAEHWVYLELQLHHILPSIICLRQYDSHTPNDSLAF